MTAFTALLSIAVFMLCLKLFGVIKVSGSVLAVSRYAIDAIRDDQLNDDEREKIVQKASIQLLGQFFSIIVRVVGVVIASFIPIWLISLTGATTAEAVFTFLSRVDVIIATSLAMVAGYLAWVRIWSRR